MAPKTLFDAAKPIIFPMNFLGYSLGCERSGSGWVKGLLTLNVKVILVCFLVIAGCLTFAMNVSFNECAYLYYFFRIFLISKSVSLVDYFVLINKTRLRNLVRQLSSFPLTKESGKALNKCSLLFYAYLIINFIFLLFVLSILIETLSIFQVSNYFLKFFVLWAFPSLFLLILFPVFLCYFACLVPVYCVALVKELVQEVKSARSSLRRAKMTSDLFRQYYRLKRLAFMTNETLSKAMSLFHALFVMLFALTAVMINSLDTFDYSQFGKIEMAYLLFYAIFFVHMFPFLMYQRVARSANHMHFLIFEALVDIVLIDDDWLSRDPILRPLLVKMRVSRVFDVSHIVLEEASFTLFGEAIEGEALFTIFMEAFDTYNNISAYHTLQFASRKFEQDKVTACQY